jgi:hypothetical protein
MTLLRSLVVVTATAALAACGSSGPSLPESDAELAGTLTDFVLGPAYLGAPTSVLVQGDVPVPDTERIVHVETSTRVYELTRGRLVPANREDLQVGDRLQVWTTGVEMRSFPAQVTATRVHIIR